MCHVPQLFRPCMEQYQNHALYLSGLEVGQMLPDLRLIPLITIIIQLLEHISSNTVGCFHMDVTCLIKLGEQQTRIEVSSVEYSYRQATVLLCYNKLNTNLRSHKNIILDFDFVPFCIICQNQIIILPLFVGIYIFVFTTFLRPDDKKKQLAGFIC